MTEAQVRELLSRTVANLDRFSVSAFVRANTLREILGWPLIMDEFSHPGLADKDPTSFEMRPPLDDYPHLHDGGSRKVEGPAGGLDHGDNPPCPGDSVGGDAIDRPESRIVLL